VHRLSVCLSSTRQTRPFGRCIQLHLNAMNSIQVGWSALYSDSCCKARTLARSCSCLYPPAFACTLIPFLSPICGQGWGLWASALREMNCCKCQTHWRTLDTMMQWMVQSVWNSGSSTDTSWSHPSEPCRYAAMCQGTCSMQVAELN
jgi:hypothetical protein